jgi:hypothetical protein
VSEPEQPPGASPGPGPDTLTGARCALHPEVVAHAICARCGNFMCSGCSLDGSADACSACRERTGSSRFPFTSDDYSIDGLLTYSWARFKEEWAVLTLSMLVFFAVIYGVAIAGTVVLGGMGALMGSGSMAASPQFVVGAQGAIQFAQIILQTWLQLGLFTVAIRVLEGKPVQVAAMFGHARRLPSALLLLLIVYLVAFVLMLPGVVAAYFIISAEAGLGAVFFAVVGAVLLPLVIYLALGTCYALCELVYDDAATAPSALRASFRMVRGHRWPTLGIVVLSGVVTFAGVLACCVGVLPAGGLGMLIFCSLFLALRTPGAAQPRVLT